MHNLVGPLICFSAVNLSHPFILFFLFTLCPPSFFVPFFGPLLLLLILVLLHLLLLLPTLARRGFPRPGSHTPAGPAPLSSSPSPPPPPSPPPSSPSSSCDPSPPMPSFSFNLFFLSPPSSSDLLLNLSLFLYITILSLPPISRLHFLRFILFIELSSTLNILGFERSGDIRVEVMRRF